jgi:hypothetical protein
MGAYTATDRLDDLADWFDYQSGLLHLDGVAAVRVADVLRVEKGREAILSGSPRRPCLRPSGTEVKSLVRREHDNRDRVYLWGGMEQIEAALVVGRFEAVGFDQLLRGFDIYVAHCAGISERFRNSEAGSTSTRPDTLSGYVLAKGLAIKPPQKCPTRT